MELDAVGVATDSPALDETVDVRLVGRGELDGGHRVVGEDLDDRGVVLAGQRLDGDGDVDGTGRERLRGRQRGVRAVLLVGAVVAPTDARGQQRGAHQQRGQAHGRTEGCRPDHCVMVAPFARGGRLLGWTAMLPGGNLELMPEFSASLNEDQLQIQKWVHDFAESVVRPAGSEWDEREEFPYPIVEEAAQVGLYSIDFMANAMFDPTGLTLPVAVEELFWGDAGIGMAIMGSGLAAAGIAGNGTPEQVGEWVPQCYGTPDKIALGAFCVSEPDAGSDVSSLRTRAVYDEAKDEWVINGTKAWITNGGIADVHVVVAAVDPELKGRGQASFVIGPDTPGLSQGQKYKKHGIRASHTAEVVLDDVRIPGRQLLGGKDKLDEKLARAREKGRSGAKQPAMATFEATRPTVGAQAIGIARAAYEYSLEYAKERMAFGKPIIMNQAIAFKLANMITEIDAARLLIWRAAWLAHNGGYTNAEGSMSKYKASEVSVWVTNEAIQILGGYGYTREYPVERWHRDAKIHTIFEGTSEIQQLVIARAISGLRIE